MMDSYAQASPYWGPRVVQNAAGGVRCPNMKEFWQHTDGDPDADPATTPAPVPYRNFS